MSQYFSVSNYPQVAIGASRPKAIWTDDYAGNKILLENVLAWLVINSMRVDGVQFNLLCEQSVSNVWRKRAFSTLCENHRMLDSEACPLQLNQCLQVFRERIDHEIENSVPQTTRYSEKISSAIDMHRYDV